MRNSAELWPSVIALNTCSSFIYTYCIIGLMYNSRKLILLYLQRIQALSQFKNMKWLSPYKINIQQLLLINNKIQLIPLQIIMSTANIVADVVRNIINQGKDVLHDHFIEKEKVPPFSNRQASSNYKQVVIHGGYQSQNLKKYAHFTLKKDNMPENIIKDNLAIKSHQIIHQPKSLIKTAPFKASQQKYYSSKKNNRQNNNSSTYNTRAEDSSKQKENKLVKLEENYNNRIIIERARLRAESEEQNMRQKKRLLMLKEYQQKLENQVFQKQVRVSQFKRKDRQVQKQKLLENHMKKGESFNFNFDHNGELMLFESSNNTKINYPPQTAFKIYSDYEQESEPIADNGKFQRQNSLDYRGKQSGGIHPLDRNFPENQRIRSARGEAFASAVMKTVNLSRISMNGSMIEVDAEQFMKRNDLFNNNHSRQTTSIPYLQPKIGTVYTQIATKQVVGSSKEPRSSTTALAKEDMSFQQRDPSKRGKAFDGFYQHADRKYSKTARVLGNRDTSNEDLVKTTQRAIKTAKQSARNSTNSERRPHTSVYRGKITTANQKLVQSLLQQ